MERLEILAEAPLAHPEAIYQALAKLAPWERLATREDLEGLKATVATKVGLEELKATMAAEEDLEKLGQEVDAQLRFLLGWARLGLSGAS